MIAKYAVEYRIPGSSFQGTYRTVVDLKRPVEMDSLATRLNVVLLKKHLLMPGDLTILSVRRIEGLSADAADRFRNVGEF